MKQYLLKLCSAGLLCGILMSPVWAEGLKVGSTLENLQAAYNGESNAHARYLKFAAKADLEGYKQVAALFRAAAKSEEIHAANHAKVITKMGAQPKKVIKKIDVKTTKENLETALKGETYERDIMYPEFAKKADADKNINASRSFKGALAAETEHARLYSEALGNLESWKVSNKEFLVCTVCGYTTDNTALTQCPVCSAPREKFVSFK